LIPTMTWVRCVAAWVKMLVDTSVWVALLRGRDTPHSRMLREILLNDEAALCPAILQELVQGARDMQALETLKARFTRLPMLEQTMDAHILAAELYARCRWRGVTIRSPHDCLIAALAIEHGTTLLQSDRDFDRIASVEPSLLLWRPEAG